MKQFSFIRIWFLPVLTFIFALKPAYSQVNFTANITSGCNPLVVNFTAVAPGAISYSWNLGNGTMSSLQNPGVTYTSSGLFNVSLTVAYANGTTQSVSKPGFISIFASPTSGFSANIINICQGESVQFTDQSIPGSNPIASWLWDFGDGDTSTVSNPNHVFTVPGVFPITLVTSDVNGCQNILVKPAYILVNPTPNADFTVDNALGCTAPHSVNFTSLPNGLGVSHIWSLGNGATPTTANPAITYTVPGSYTVSHIVTDTLGCADTVVKTNLISVGQNTVNIQASDYLVCPNEVVNFFCNSPIGSLVNWTFGVPGPGSTACNPTFSYSAPGTYVVSATITNGSGCTFNGSTIITVSAPPVVDFTASDTLFCDPLFEVDFTNNSTGAVSYAWQFGDGAISSLTSPTHIYPTLPVFSQTGQPYFYTVKLTATNVDGCSTTVVKPFHITTGQTGAFFDAIPRNGCAPVDIQFSNQSYSPSPVVSFFWDFGNGVTDTVANPLVTYQDTGSYDVTLIIETLHGCRDTLTASGYIEAGEKPIADFIADTTYSCASGEIEFTNLSSPDTDSVYWYFGDGGQSGIWDPIHQFQDTGYMDVMLIAFDRGCPDTLVKTDYIYIDPPIALFLPMFPFICDIPATIPFTDLSIGAHHWLWDFGDGSPTTTIQNPTHTYTQEGDYTVALIVFNDSTQCGDTTYSIITIKTVKADFVSDTIFGCRPLTVNFTDSSTNAIKWFWNFGDSNSSISQNPSHTYIYSGVYTVSLFVLNSIFCPDDTVVLQHIKVYEPKVDFNVTDPTGCAPYSVPFTNLTTSLGPVTTWNWNFGVPGATSGLQSPIYTYTNPGAYTVTLTATDSIGCTSSKTIPNYVFVTEPVPLFTVNHQVHCVNNPIVFNNLSSGFGITGYQWNFGDNTTSNSQNPVHIYTANGVYNVSLTVSDINGCDSTYTLPITIATPQVGFVADTTFASCPPLLVNFTSSIFSPHTFTGWQWNFGDLSTSVAPNPSHVYAVPGDFDVTLIATTAGGCKDTVTIPSLIDIGGPYGSFSFTPLQICPGFPVSFSATGTPNVAQFNWDLDGGNLAVGQNITFSYTNPGIYHPLLIVEDSAGCQVLIESQDSILVFPKPVANFNVTAPLLCDSGTVNFSNLSTPAALVNQWNWNFGDNSTASGFANPAHFYNQPGTYSVELVVTTINGCKDTVQLPSIVTVNTSPRALIGVSDSAGCMPHSVFFTDISSVNSSPTQTWQWSPGISGVAASTQNYSFTYPNPGFYTATLTITDVNGCTGTDNQNVEVWALPEPNFVADDSLGCAPKIVQFTDLTPTSIDWRWNFGDFTPQSQLEDPMHIYQADGIYTVTLQVWDVNGCTDSLKKPNYIVLDHPDAGFTVSDRIVCPATPVAFTDNSLSDTLLIGWLWDFGDNTTSTQQNPAHSYQNPGFYDITLTVTDIFGCTDVFIQRAHIQVLVDEEPLVPGIRYVTVKSDVAVEISFDPYDNFRNDFARYEVFRQDGSGNWQMIFFTTNINETTITDAGLNTRNNVYCYRLEVVNYCDRRSDPTDSEIHCTIQLTTNPQTDQILLSWTPYVGWGAVSEYRIFRVGGYATTGITLIGTVSGNVTTFTDTDMFCYDAQTYRIEATQLGSATVSWSNISKNVPLHFGPPNPLHTVRATVEDNRFVKVEWEDIPAGDDLVRVEIERDAGNGFQQLLSQPVSSPVRIYEDKDVAVNSQFYQYRALVVDTCGDRTPLGRIATSIHLRAERIRGVVYLDWNPYQTWALGIDIYEIEVFDETALQYVQVGTVPGSVNEYIDEKTDLPQGSYCYRVTAWEAGGNEQSSLSNEVCVVVDPLLYFPNAFTPNYDLINDRFVIPGAFIAQFRMEIFSRWGQKIFETDSQEEGWDGTADGAAVPEGVYVFKVNGVGFSGEVIQRSGTVTLLR
ncbi:MAG: PKD domain-containing protein [Bacteroidia bacterium]|nr:PKD domain-containing protein [Bacteroidia bacterium]